MIFRKNGMTSSGKNESEEIQYQELLDQIAESKKANRIRLAKLPFPEKVRIIVELQKIDSALSKAAGRKPRKVWEID